MGELGLRLALVAGTLLVVAIVTWAQQARTRPSARVVPSAGVAPGVFLLTSTDCASCERARRVLGRRTDFTELSWQDSPDLFTRLEVEAVPAVLVVDKTGRGVLNFGSPRFVHLGGNP